MTEVLTAADISTLIGWGLGCFALGFIGGRLQLAFKKTFEQL